MNNNNKTRKRAQRIFALVLVIALLSSSAFYLLMVVGSMLGADISAGVAYGAERINLDVTGMGLSQTERARLENIPFMLQFLKETFKDELTYGEMIEGMYNGMFDSLEDEWSEYYFSGDTTPDQVSMSLDGEFYGVGISSTGTAEGLKILSVIEGGPAQKAGIKEGSVITHVNGTDVRGMDSSEAILLIRGEEGTFVTLTVVQEGSPKTYTLQRQKIEAASVTGSMAEGTTGYIEIDSFSTTTAKEFKQTALKLKQQGMDRMVIDLRNNTGGYVDQAWEIASILIPSGVCGYYISKGEVSETFYAKGSDLATMPIAVLINEYSASASEMLSAALKDAGRAVFVGEVSYGKGVAQGIYELKNGDQFKVSMVYFTGRNKQPIDGIGIVPDHIVYSYGGYTTSQAAELLGSMVELAEEERYYEGEEGLNVLAAQQRLILLGYGDVKPTGIMDEATMAALRLVQRAAGSYSYGNLDNFTIKALAEQFDALLGFDKDGNHADTQLEKALEVVRTMK
ncbi:MAG: S41 family peptidase [Firmicutes bacterium]|nr:S41 family peptidase [Bacillota bacterium]